MICVVLLVCHSPSYVFMGGSAEVGAFKNCFGASSAFVRRDAFTAMGGYTEEEDAGYEDWEFYAKTALNGLKVRRTRASASVLRSRSEFEGCLLLVPVPPIHLPRKRNIALQSVH